MKKYSISLGGKGAECSLFPLTQEQSQDLIDMGIEKDEMSIDEITDFLGVDDLISSSDRIVTGAYYGDHYISVFDENGGEVWNSEEYEYDETDWVDGGLPETDYLVVEDYSKGEFFTFNLEIEEDFDPSKLIPIITEIAESKEIITGFRYDEMDISETAEFGNYWSKGFYYTVYQTGF